MLKRAQRIRSQEDLVLPLYEPLAKAAGEGDYRAPFFSVLTALAVASNDTMWEKLTFITDLFDVNCNKVGRRRLFVLKPPRSLPTVRNQARLFNTAASIWVVLVASRVHKIYHASIIL